MTRITLVLGPVLARKGGYSFEHWDTAERKRKWKYLYRSLKEARHELCATARGVTAARDYDAIATEDVEEFEKIIHRLEKPAA